jgi:hypothetical protein
MAGPERWKRLAIRIFTVQRLSRPALPSLTYPSLTLFTGPQSMNGSRSYYTVKSKESSRQASRKNTYCVDATYKKEK